MARTNRNVPAHIRARAERNMESVKNDNWGPSSGRRIERTSKKIIQGRDGSISSDAHAGWVKSPKGYNTWDEVGSNSKDWAKKSASRARRLQAQEQIRNEVSSLEDSE